MCTVNEAEFEEVVQCMDVKPTGIPIEASCKKCHEQKAEVLLRVRDVYCRQCFLAAATHKFRAVLGKSRLMRLQENVLIAFSGSQSSVALIHLVKSGLDETSHKRLQYTPYAVYIDEGAVLEQTPEERQQICNSVAEFLSKYKIPTFVSSLDRSLDKLSECSRLCQSLHPNTKLDIHDESDLNIQKLFNSVHSLTAKEDLLNKLRNRLLFKIAKELKCHKIFAADTETNLAIKLLTNMSLGRGAQLPLDVGFCDSRDSEVKLLRPMRDFMNKEIAFYNIFNDLEAINSTSLGTKVNAYASIQKLTETFVIDLQENFPSTVSTVFRTGDKLSLDRDSTSSDESCVLCQAQLDTSHVESSALQATEFSRMVSTLGPLEFDNQTLTAFQTVEKPAEEGVCCAESSSSHCQCRNGTITCVTHAEAKEWLCYGCRLITKEMVSLDALPSDIVQTIKERSRMKQMKNEIQDFLL